MGRAEGKIPHMLVIEDDVSTLELYREVLQADGLIYQRRDTHMETYMAMTDVLERPAPVKRVTLHEPASGWSGDVYAGALRAYAALHGRPPQTATMHPTTAAVLGVSDGPATLSGLSRAPLVVTSLDYEGHTITFYY